MRWSRLLEVRLIAAAGLVASTALMLAGGADHPWPRVFEGGLYACALLLLTSHGPLRQTFAALPRPQRRFLLGFTALLVATQLVSKPRGTFPFIPWTMYTIRLPEPPRYYEFVGIRADGGEVLIPAGAVFRSQQRSAYWRLTELWSSMQSAEDEQRRGQLERTLRSLLTALVDKFNAENPGAPVQRVRLVECTMPRPEPGRALQVTRRPLAELPIDGGWAQFVAARSGRSSAALEDRAQRR